MNNAKIIAVTEPIKMINCEATSVDAFIAYVARISNPSNQNNTLTAPKLLRYLAKHKHWSPFEMVNIVMEIETTRDIARQILRHRSFSFQEFSQRYSVATKLEDIQWRMQGKTNRQVGDGEFELSPEDRAWMYQIQKESQSLYNKLIDAGVARESARFILPLNTQTTLYMSGTLRSWITYLQLRTKQDTQKEHRDIAEALKVIFKQEFPVISEALFDNWF